MSDLSVKKVRKLKRLEKLPVTEDNYENQRKAKAILREFVTSRDLDASVHDNFVIIYAARHGHRKMVKKLMETYRVKPSAQKNLALREAALRGHEDIVKLLMRHPHVNNGCHEQLAMKVLSFGHLEIARCLLGFDGLDVNDYDSVNGALCWAVQNGHESHFMICMKCPAVDPSAYKNRALQNAVSDGRLEMVKILLEDPRVDPSQIQPSSVFPPLVTAISKGSPEMVELLIRDPRTNKSCSDNKPIRSASFWGMERIVDLLLQYPDVDPTAVNNAAIRAAVEGGCCGVVSRLLRDPRVDPSRIGITILNFCIQKSIHFDGEFTRKDYQETVKVLLTDGRVKMDGFDEENQKYVDELRMEKIECQLAVEFVGSAVGNGWKDLAYEVGRRLWY